MCAPMRRRLQSECKYGQYLHSLFIADRYRSTYWAGIGDGLLDHSSLANILLELSTFNRVNFFSLAELSFTNSWR